MQLVQLAAATPEPPRFTRHEIETVAAAYSQWKLILSVYFYDFEAGVAMYESMDSRCGLCEQYEQRTTRLVRGRLYGYLSCRACPVVRACGRTCEHVRAAHGLDPGFHTHEAQAYWGVARVVRTLKGIFIYMKANRVNQAVEKAVGSGLSALGKTKAKNKAQLRAAGASPPEPKAQSQKPDRAKREY